jgi:hypothetical protein
LGLRLSRMAWACQGGCVRERSGFTIHATKKLLDRVGELATGPVVPATALGNWYGTVLFWRPQVALLVNEATLVPVLIRLAPAATLMRRFPAELRRVLGAHGVDQEFVDREVRAMGHGSYAKTASRSLVGVMNEFAYLGNVYRGDADGGHDLAAMSVRLARTPMSPLYQRHISPDRELRALVAREIA